MFERLGARQHICTATRKVRELGRTLAAAGTASYPPDVRRRLKILNVMCYLIATTTLIYAAQQALTDYQAYAPMVWVNVVLAAVVLVVPLTHRISEISGGLLLVGAEYAALLAFTQFFSREGGASLQYIIAAAAPFVIFGLQRIRLIALVVISGLALHLFAWFRFPAPADLTATERSVLDANYTQAAITTVGLIAASVYYAFHLAEQAKAETDAVLHNVLPDVIVERLKADPHTLIADNYECGSVLFADISGFVGIARRLGAAATVDLLSRIVTEFDSLATQHGVEKIKTIGDAYMVASGLPVPSDGHTVKLARMAHDMLAAIERHNAASDFAIGIRIGIASGPVTAGVIGKRKFSYDVWGDPVNLANRLEARSQTGRILICPCTHDLLGNAFRYEACGPMEIKGLGMQEAWFLLGEALPPVDHHAA
ncbi:adenylate/guanylate cyclase domain-containing protein [Hyphomicrobium sp. D-2]|uniref:adenylate/guanylate cyclase domain-containing protein n=1 Tax=Hyphomicrobium sp. D-2 TaxID=3041621 RepID=UPI0024541917|nr:adenylate/guanylate cyclase domain-containing protein [Hyphomicrobium sp. D-2]MDH4981902.1 adenylate/guanylate cyclase domain-containing protein [Hyphomicrobium sp. D-2]